MTRLAPVAQAAEIVEARAILEAMTGAAMVPVFWPPYGAWDRGLLAVALAAKFAAVLLWDTTAGDTSARASPAPLVRSATRGTNGSVVLAHGGPALTPLILPTVIAVYRDLGFRFVSVPELLGLPAGRQRAAGRAWPARPHAL